MLNNGSWQGCEIRVQMLVGSVNPLREPFFTKYALGGGGYARADGECQGVDGTDPVLHDFPPRRAQIAGKGPCSERGGCAAPRNRRTGASVGYRTGGRRGR